MFKFINRASQWFQQAAFIIEHSNLDAPLLEQSDTTTMKKPKPGDRTKTTTGKREGQIGVHERHTNNGATNQGCVLPLGEAEERRLWLSWVRVHNQSTQME